MIKCQFFLVVNDSTFVYTGYEFYPLYGSLLTLKGEKDSKYTFDINHDSFTIHKTKFFFLLNCSFLMFLLGPRKIRT